MPPPPLTRATLAIAGILASLAPSAIGAEASNSAEPRVLFERDGALWAAPAGGGGEDEKLADLDRPVSGLEALDARGDVVLGQGGDEVFLVDLGGDEPSRVRMLPCHPPAQLSAGGEAVLCRREDAVLKVPSQGSLIRVLRRPGVSAAGFFGRDADRAVIADDRAICAFSFSGGPTNCLAPHSPAPNDLHPAPDGSRAAATYEREGQPPTLYSFRLDGRGVRRGLLRAARAVAWSADSAWLAAQRGSRACLVRAVGGQYKCWRDFRALALSPDGQHIVLSKGEGSVDIYVAPLAGPRPVAPTRIARGANSAAAAWLPESHEE